MSQGRIGKPWPMVALLIVIVTVNLVLAAVVIGLSISSDRGRSVHG